MRWKRERQEREARIAKMIADMERRDRSQDAVALLREAQSDRSLRYPDMERLTEWIRNGGGTIEPFYDRLYATDALATIESVLR